LENYGHEPEHFDNSVGCCLSEVFTFQECCEDIRTSEMNCGFACGRVNAALRAPYICVSMKKATDTSCS